MAGLTVRRCSSSSYPWEVVVESGPSGGLRASPDGFRTKREAQGWVDTQNHLPWDNARSVTSAVDANDLLVTVARIELVRLAQQVERLEAELAAHKRVLLDVDGSWMLLDAARKAVAAEAAA